MQPLIERRSNTHDDLVHDRLGDIVAQGIEHGQQLVVLDAILG